ncbi:glycoside hydrolase family 2 protein [Gramella sp. KN1008]|uniref:glycoside hydrolase family 2 protein n=1 Tax=Gramella sp. KN1008 TaxID=2529298 RepID=UPI00103CEEB1|nr:glycoside hydrolase family 2 TIM barrel-domain containing protein [Gramella sp. KN1008]TBW30236.1 beta-glucuronidase [Gramella sp. KN1008]
MNQKLLYILVFILFLTAFPLTAQEDLIINTHNRDHISLNGDWHYIIDPYENGFYNYRYKERNEADPEAYWNRPVIKEPSDRIEHAYSDNYSLKVPGDWNSQDPVFKYYEGSVWYQREFDLTEAQTSGTAYMYFGAANYEAHVYLNGKKLGMHKGGFTPFNFKIPPGLLKAKGNFLVVKVDNKRSPEEIPTVNTDWWNFGGITRDVKLLLLPDNFIQQYSLQLDPENFSADRKNQILKGHFKLNKPAENSEITIFIPELKLKEKLSINGQHLEYKLPFKKPELWSPENPKLYEVEFIYGKDTLRDKIGFRDIRVAGKDVILNGKKIFLRGISIHEEIPQEVRRARNKKDAQQLLDWAKELNANMVRLAHYPHNEYMTHTADSLGMLVWSEIPVYWTINFRSEEVLEKAKKQLGEMIIRDRNKASVIIWSVGNETPVSPHRTAFMKSLVQTARAMDNSRLISAALEVHRENGRNIINDPLGESIDIVSVNEYLGWYGGLPSAKENSTWEVTYNKPLFFSETGAGAKAGYHGDRNQRWTEEFQAWYFKETIKMMKRMPENFTGMSPWILTDFRSPRRNHPRFQEGWNRKGLIDNNGNKKKAFYILQEYYKEIENRS